MERICPFLALEGDARTVVAGFDPEHRCGAVNPATALERSQQLALCLEPGHRGCPRYAAVMGTRGAPPGWMPAADATLATTRLVLQPESSARLLTRARAPGQLARRWALGGALALIGAVAVAGGVTGALGSLPSVGLQASSMDGVPLETLAASPQPAAWAATSQPETPSQAPATPPPASATAAPVTPPPTPAPTQAPQPRTYVVQEGDTLHDIAVRFGTSVEAIQRANGLADTDLIVVGQRLVIP